MKESDRPKQPDIDGGLFKLFCRTELCGSAEDLFNSEQNQVVCCVNRVMKPGVPLQS
jgi:hypothetical protein